MKKYYEFNCEYYALIGAEDKELDEVKRYYEENVSNLEYDDVSNVMELSYEEMKEIYFNKVDSNELELTSQLEDGWYDGFNFLLIDSNLL